MSLTGLILPILVSSVAVFIASSIIHMATPWHKNDFPNYSGEDAILNALAPLNIPPGDYFMPRPYVRADMKSPEFLAKLHRGPVLLMTVMENAPVNMGKAMGGWFVYLVVVNVIIALVGAAGFHTGQNHSVLLHQALLTGFAAYGLALCQMRIWYRRSLSLTLKALFDAVIYSAISAGIFVWLWPALMG